MDVEGTSSFYPSGKTYRFTAGSFESNHEKFYSFPHSQPPKQMMTY